MSLKTAVYYKDFGAVGDGITDDYKAIFAAHAYANENGLSVVAEAGKSYYIGKGTLESVVIKTDTDWTGAQIIIDDRFIGPNDPEIKISLFKVVSEYSGIRHDEDSELVKAINASGGIKTDTKKIPYKPGRDTMLIPCNAEKMMYIRYGANKNDGDRQHEVMIIDGEGNIDKDTPALFDYEKITSVIERRIDDKPITLQGGTFTTHANQAPPAYTYFSRNIEICRSNVTVKNVTHTITDEGDHGAPYGGFFVVSNSNNVTFDSCIFQAHRYYFNENPNRGGLTPMGTYELSIGNANKIYFKNCKQSNYYDRETGKPSDRFFDAEGKCVGEGVWGVMGSNYSKNITYDGCVLNRYDAHAGVYNATIINSDIKDICLIGGGCARIENSVIHNRTVVILRGDYGSFWNGDLIIKNTKFISNRETPSLISGVWFNHDFGYKTSLPNIYIDGLSVENAEDISIFTDYAENQKAGDFTKETVVVDGVEVENNNPMSIPEKIYVKNSSELIRRVAPAGTWLCDKAEIITE